MKGKSRSEEMNERQKTDVKRENVVKMVSVLVRGRSVVCVCVCGDKSGMKLVEERGDNGRKEYMRGKRRKKWVS